MTKAQEWIRRYLETQFIGVRYEERGIDRIAVIDCKGEEMEFMTNDFADIIDAKTGQIIAISDCSHRGRVNKIRRTHSMGKSAIIFWITALLVWARINSD